MNSVRQCLSAKCPQEERVRNIFFSFFERVVQRGAFYNWVGKASFGLGDIRCCKRTRRAYRTRIDSESPSEQGTRA
ncbi:hypothetical protein V1478_014871 [Vespula squamosa]|uniref:Uncharacterized protein n=1 Tax=Vespula squamosa TaxID=30214 RepID=A0ABD2A3G6_VESSQ